MRHRRLPVAHLALALALALTLGACKREAEPGEKPKDIPDTVPDLDPRQLSALDEGLDDLETVPDDMRHIVALTSIAVVSADRLPPDYGKGLLAYMQAPTEERSERAALLMTEHAWLFTEVCRQDFIAVMEEVSAQSGSGQKLGRVWSACEFERFDLLEDRAQFIEASERGIEPMLAYFTYGYLELHGGAHELERALLVEATRP